MKKTYLGDGVYAAVEWGTVVLTTENGGDKPTNRIVLEARVAETLALFIEAFERDCEALS